MGLMPAMDYGRLRILRRFATFQVAKFPERHLINEVFSTQINQMRSFSSFVRLAPMPLAIVTTSVRSHVGCAAGFSDNFFQRLLSSLTRLFP